MIAAVEAPLHLPVLPWRRPGVGRGQSLTIGSYRSLSRQEKRRGSELTHPADAERPKTRGDCVDAERPCPWVSCRHHLYLDALPSGAVKLNWPGLEPSDLEQSCALDVADQGGQTLEQVASYVNLTRERVRQIEMAAEARLRGRVDPDELLPEGDRE